MRSIGRLLVLLLGVVSVHCATSSTLSSEERAKLDAALERLVAGRPQSIDTYTTSSRGDSTVYSVFITTNDVEQLREAGLPVGSVMGNVVTARLTISEIRTAAGLSSVRTIDNPSRAYPQSNEN